MTQMSKLITTAADNYNKYMQMKKTEKNFILMLNS